MLTSSNRRTSQHTLGSSHTETLDTPSTQDTSHTETLGTSHRDTGHIKHTDRLRKMSSLSYCILWRVKVRPGRVDGGWPFVCRRQRLSAEKTQVVVLWLPVALIQRWFPWPFRCNCQWIHRCYALLQNSWHRGRIPAAMILALGLTFQMLFGRYR